MTLFKTPYDIIFYYPQHFNRSEKGTNLFFDPLVAICEENGLSYLLVEEPDNKTIFPRNKKAVPFGFWLYTIIVLRKLIPTSFFKNNTQKEIFIGKIIALFTFNFFKAKTYITISNSMIDVLLGFNDKARVFDLQHGIIYAKHPGYFQSDGTLNEFLNQERIGFLLAGNGFRELFYKNNASIMEQKCRVIGNSTSEEIESSNVYSKKTILYTLQFTEDFNIDDLNIEKQELQLFLTSFQKIAIENNLSILLKHHPRYNNAIAISDILEQFPFATITNSNFEELSKSVFLHLTKYSTSAFELAKMTIPTVFITNKIAESIFHDEYQYPNYNFTLEEWIELYCTNNPTFFELAGVAKKWSNHFYEPLNKALFLSIICSNKN